MIILLPYFYIMKCFTYPPQYLGDNIRTGHYKKELASYAHTQNAEEDAKCLCCHPQFNQFTWDKHLNSLSLSFSLDLLPFPSFSPLPLSPWPLSISFPSFWVPAPHRWGNVSDEQASRLFNLSWVNMNCFIGQASDISFYKIPPSYLRWEKKK